MHGSELIVIPPLEHLWRLELEPTPTLIVSELKDGRYVERTVAEAGQSTLVEGPGFVIKVDPGQLVNPSR